MSMAIYVEIMQSEDEEMERTVQSTWDDISQPEQTW